MRYFSTILLLITLVGCQKFHIIQVSKSGEDIVFDNDLVTSSCTKSVLIYDFEVTHTQNGVTKTAWMLIRNQQPSNEQKVFEFPLVYGKNIEGVNTTTKAMEIKPGVYKLGATLSCLTQGKSKSISLVGSFAISQNGDLITDEDIISTMENKI